jgi:hypothetical protein
MVLYLPFFKSKIFYKTAEHVFNRDLNDNKGKAMPLYAWTDPESSRRMVLSDFKTIGT